MRTVVVVGLAIVVLLTGPSVHPQSPQSQSTASSVDSLSAEPLYAAPTTRDGVGRIVVPVMINDKGPFRFVLDTGANRSVLAAHMTERLGLTLSDETMSVELSGVTGQAIVRTATVDRLQAGALLLQNLNMPVIGPTLSGVDGVLGVEGFRGMRLTIDFVRDSVSIERSRTQRTLPEFVTLPARFRHGRLLVVDATVGRVKASAVIDSGAEGSLGTERLRQLLQWRLREDAVRETRQVQGVTSDVQSGALVYSPLIRFEGVEIEGVKIAYGDFHVFKLWGLEKKPALLVGMDILGTVDTLVIDYRRGEIQIKPRASLLN